MPGLSRPFLRVGLEPLVPAACGGWGLGPAAQPRHSRRRRRRERAGETRVFCASDSTRLVRIHQLDVVISRTMGLQHLLQHLLLCQSVYYTTESKHHCDLQEWQTLRSKSLRFAIRPK